VQEQIMSKKATAYILSILAIAGMIVAFSLSSSDRLSTEWLLLLVLVVLTSIAHLYMSDTASHEAWGINLVFLFTGVVLLNSFDFGLLVIIPHVIEWGYEVWIKKSTRLRNWYIQPFNIAVHLIAGFIARTLFLALNQDPTNLATIAAFLAAAVAIAGYLAVNHALVGFVLVFARSVTLRESGVFEPGNLIGDLTQFSLGYVVAVVWQINPVLLLPTLAPLLLIFRAIQVPRLTKEAHTDAKTGLWNMRHFNEIFSAELARARRFERPLAVVMADLDLLRNVNNTYGHLAGDAVLTGIGRIIRQGIRDYDLAARFGGEEFSIVLLEADVEAARTFANRIRMKIAETEFVIPTSPTPIHVTMSLGVACYPDDADTANDLIQLADVAVYQAKLHGRNRVVCVADVPQSIRLESELPADHAATTYQAAHLPRSISASPMDNALPDGAPSPDQL
jgi:diguanylate cyclase (GGDEF)-like protein